MLKRFALTGLLLALTGCGFSPIYATHSNKQPVAQALSNVAIESIPDANGQFLRNKLIDRMYFKGKPTQPQARLSVKLKSAENELGIKKDATASRNQLNVWADYILRDNEGRELLKHKAHATASYNKIEAQYGLVATQRNAYERCLNEVAEQIVNAVSVYYAEQDQAPKQQAPAPQRSTK